MESYNTYLLKGMFGKRVELDDAWAFPRLAELGHSHGTVTSLLLMVPFQPEAG